MYATSALLLLLLTKQTVLIMEKSDKKKFNLDYIFKGKGA